MFKYIRLYIPLSRFYLASHFIFCRRVLRTKDGGLSNGIRTRESPIDPLGTSPSGPRGAVSNIGKGNFPTSKLDDTEGFQGLGHSNWTICSPLSLFCSDIFATFSLSYWRGQFLSPQRTNNGKREFSLIQN